MKFPFWESLQQNAKLGDIKAQSDLGAMYYEGWGVGIDLDQSQLLLQKAEANGYWPASYTLNIVNKGINSVQKAIAREKRLQAEADAKATKIDVKAKAKTKTKGETES